jgi:hypothetical protein
MFEGLGVLLGVAAYDCRQVRRVGQISEITASKSNADSRRPTDLDVDFIVE